MPRGWNRSGGCRYRVRVIRKSQPECLTVFPAVVTSQFAKYNEYNFASDRDKKALSEALQFFCSEATIQDLNPSNTQLLREQQALNDKVASHEQSQAFKAQLHRCGVLNVRATSCFDFGQCVGRAEENRRSSQGLTE